MGRRRQKRTASRQSCPNPEGYQICQALFSPQQFARIFSPCSRRLRCLRPPRMTSPPATRSTRRSTTRPTTSPRRASTTAPATSTTCSTASVTACRCCRLPTPASLRCRAWSIPPSRSPTRCCRRPPAIRLIRRIVRQQPSPAPRPTWLTAPASKPATLSPFAATTGLPAVTVTFGATSRSPSSIRLWQPAT